jgi:uncharacterized Zn-binding protein involved in type VI secretion
VAAAGRVGIDTAGGLLTLPGLQTFVRIAGAPWAVLGQPIASHGIPPHSSATMAQGDAWLLIGGVPACRAAHLATCGHALTPTVTFFVNVVP